MHIIATLRRIDQQFFRIRWRAPVPHVLLFPMSQQQIKLIIKKTAKLNKMLRHMNILII